MSIMGQ